MVTFKSSVSSVEANYLYFYIDLQVTVVIIKGYSNMEVWVFKEKLLTMATALL